MANGTIAFDTLSTSGQIDGTARSIDTDYLLNGSAKCWINQDDQTTINDSFNVGSLTDVGGGRGGVNFSNNMSNANFAPVVSATNTAANSGVNIGSYERDSISTSKFNMRTGTPSSGPEDQDSVTGVAHGELA
tara:strand:+ start:287 stop:685 length:399 start_codon:yes stop_codon:yes gene_type:complete